MRRMPDDASAAPQQLFAALRAFDDQGVKRSGLKPRPPPPEWEGVRDRCNRGSIDWKPLSRFATGGRRHAAGRPLRGGRWPRRCQWQSSRIRNTNIASVVPVALHALTRHR